MESDDVEGRAMIWRSECGASVHLASQSTRTIKIRMVASFKRFAKSKIQSSISTHKVVSLRICMQVFQIALAHALLARVNLPLPPNPNVPRHLFLPA